MLIESFGDQRHADQEQKTQREDFDRRVAVHEIVQRPGEHEHHAYGETEEKAGEYAEDLAASMLATTLGIEFNSDTAWDEREQLFKMSGKIVKTSNMTQSAIGNKDGLWTTVFAAAVFVEDNNDNTMEQKTA